MYIYITNLKARSKTARYERDSLKSSHARHLPASNYMIICTVIYLYTHSIHIRTLTDKTHRDGLHTQTGYTQTLKGHFPSQSPRTRDFIKFALFHKSFNNFISTFTCYFTNMYFLNDRLFKNSGFPLFLVL
jgi:hypothetical protein